VERRQAPVRVADMGMPVADAPVDPNEGTANEDAPNEGTASHTGIELFEDFYRAQADGGSTCSACHQRSSVFLGHALCMKLSEWARRNGVHYQTAGSD